jgi:hypothetical protein
MHPSDLSDARRPRQTDRSFTAFSTLIGSIRRECVDHVVALGGQHLRRVLRSYASYYNETRPFRYFLPGFKVRGIVNNLSISTLDDRFRESCHKRGIHLGFQTPI